MHGLRGVIDRDDLPGVREIIRIAKKRREHYLGLPLLAAWRKGIVVARVLAEQGAQQGTRLCGLLPQLGAGPLWVR